MEYIETDNLFTTSPNPDFVVIDIQPVLYIGGNIGTTNSV